MMNIESDIIKRELMKSEKSIMAVSTHEPINNKVLISSLHGEIYTPDGIVKFTPRLIIPNPGNKSLIKAEWAYSLHLEYMKNLRDEYNTSIPSTDACEAYEELLDEARFKLKLLGDRLRYLRKQNR